MDFVELKVGFSRSRKWWKVGSKVIMATEKRNFSHAYIRYVCPITKETMICQASHGYVNEMNLDIFVKENIITHEYIIKVSMEDFIEVLTFCKRHLGVKYSTKEIFMIAIKKIFHVTINEYDGDETFICSEWGARVLKSLRFLNNAKLDYMTPSDFNEILTLACREKPNLIYRVTF